MKTIFLSVILLSVVSVFAQDNRPDDFLNTEFHKSRREKLRELLPGNSVAVFFANPIRNRANDVSYVYHQDPDFYYLTGYTEPHSVLLIFKEMQTAADGSAYNELIFIQKRDPQREMWTGRRLGVDGARQRTGIQHVYEGGAFASYNLDLSKFRQVLFFEFNDDVRDTSDKADLYDLIKSFKEKINYPSAQNLNVQVEPGRNKLNTTLLPSIMSALRGVKTDEEIALIRKAIAISVIGQNEVMRAIKPGMSEREIQGIHEFIHKKYQAEDVGYPSIIGAGNNGCILHYEENYKPGVLSNELILMDVGAEYRGYTADVTRTIPVSGKFSPEQKQIYDLVLKSQEAGIEVCKAGGSIQQLNEVTRRVINQGLAELNIIASPNSPNQYYPHGCCHHIGLDVHDRGSARLEENMVITIEPGIYIPEGSNTDKKWWGIGVRIEDDFLVKKDGCENLSIGAPRTTEAIEALMQENSVLNELVLPELGG